MCVCSYSKNGTFFLTSEWYDNTNDVEDEGSEVVLLCKQAHIKFNWIEIQSLRFLKKQVNSDTADFATNSIN